MQVMILAAGRSTRLGSLGTQVPKPLVPICGYPALAFGLELCREAGLLNVVMNVHHHGAQIRDLVADGAAFGVRVTHSSEAELLGTGGGLVAARHHFEPGPVLVMNGKVVCEIDLRSFINAHASGPPCLATMLVRPAPPGDAFAPVLVDEAGDVVALRGQPRRAAPQGSPRRMMFTGIHIVSPELLDLLPASGPSDVIADSYLKTLAAGGVVRAVEHAGFFAENSTPERYWHTNMQLLDDPQLLSRAPGPLSGIEAGAIVDPSAVVREPVRIQSGARLEAGSVVGPGAVVGRGATVGAGVTVRQSVVWPGVNLSAETAPLSRQRPMHPVEPSTTSGAQPPNGRPTVSNSTGVVEGCVATPEGLFVVADAQRLR